MYDELEELRTENKKLKARLRCKCNFYRSTRQQHFMYCPEYVGPLEHKLQYTGINWTFGGSDYQCTCGGYCRVWDDETPVCPRVDQTWRGPEDYNEPLPF